MIVDSEGIPIELIVHQANFSNPSEKFTSLGKLYELTLRNVNSHLNH